MSRIDVNLPIQNRMGHLLFLDEAGHPRGHGFVLGGVAVEIGRWQRLCQRWRERFPEARAELKWRGTHGASGKAGHLMELLRDAESSAFAVIIEPQESGRAAPALFTTSEGEYCTALTFVAERFQLLLERVDSHGLIVIDAREKTLDEQMRVFFARLAHEGTSFRALDQIVAPILMSPSHHALGVQAADLIVGPLHALTRTDGEELREERRGQAAALHERARPLFDRHPGTGEIGGVGIKRFPEPAPERPGRLFPVPPSVRPAA